VVNTSNLAFSGIDGESLLMLLDSSGVAASHGSACSSGALEPSRVLLNMGLPMELARASLRFSFSRMNTVDEIDRAVLIVVKIVRQLREMRKKGLTAI
jgi:cysteine desulfurase